MDKFLGKKEYNSYMSGKVAVLKETCWKHQPQIQWIELNYCQFQNSTPFINDQKDTGRKG